MTNKTFDRITVIRRVDDLIDKNGRKYVRWACKCNCGNPNEFYVLGDNLRTKKVKSCGCLRKYNMSIIRNRTCKDNQYDLSNDFGIGWTTNTNKPFYFDLEDYDLIKGHRWYEQNGYVVCVVNEKKNLQMQNLIMDPQKGERVDHIRHNTMDNRKSQLRIGTISDNTINRRKSKSNKSGVPGVCWHKGTRKWSAYITKNKKRYFLGVYSNIEDAIKVRMQAENDLFGEWSYKNSINSNGTNS